MGADDGHGVELCVSHLVGLGHRKLIHLAGPRDTSTGRERASAFREAGRSHRLRAAPVIECEAFTEEAGAKAAARALRTAGPFTAIVAGNDLLAMGAIDALRAAGLRCPDDVSVTGFNDVAFMSRIEPPMTTVHIPLTDMGALAARTLLDWVAEPGGPGHTQTLLPVELVVRGSTAAPGGQPPAPVTPA